MLEIIKSFLYLCVYKHEYIWGLSFSICVCVCMYACRYVCVCVCIYGVYTHVYPSLVPLVGRIVSIKSWDHWSLMWYTIILKVYFDYFFLYPVLLQSLCLYGNKIAYLDDINILLSPWTFSVSLLSTIWILLRKWHPQRLCEKVLTLLFMKPSDSQSWGWMVGS